MGEKDLAESVRAIESSGEKLQKLYEFAEIPGTDLEVRVFFGGMEEKPGDDSFKSALRYTKKLDDVLSFKEQLLEHGADLLDDNGLVIGGKTGLALGPSNSTTWSFNVHKERMTLRYFQDTNTLEVTPLNTLKEVSPNIDLTEGEISKVRSAYASGKSVSEIVAEFGPTNKKNLESLVGYVVGNTIFVRDNIPTSKYQERLTNVHVLDSMNAEPVALDLSLPARAVEANFDKKEAPAMVSVEIPTGYEYTERGAQLALVFRLNQPN